MDYAENKKVEASTISGDNKIEVSGIMPKDATANVAKLERANAVEMAKKYKENIKEENVINAFDISVKSEDIKYQPAEHNQEVKVKISNLDLDISKDYALLHIMDDNNYEIIPCSVLNAKQLEFRATSFSVYILITVGSNTVSFEGENYKVYDTTGKEITDGTVIESNTNFNFKVVPEKGYGITNATASGATLETAGNYKGMDCGIDSVTENVTISITTTEIFEITTQPVSTKVNLGEEATFTVSAPNATSYRWMYKLNDESEWKDVDSSIGAKGYDSTTLIIATGTTSLDENLNLVNSLSGAKFKCIITKSGTEDYILESDIAVLSIAQDEVQSEEIILEEPPMLMERTSEQYTEVYYVIGYERAKTQYLCEDIKTITLLETKEVPLDLDSWDVSYNNDGSVMAWVQPNKDDSTMYDLYIGGNGGIMAPERARMLFENYINCIEINNLSYLDTSKVYDFSRMFTGNKLLTSLDVDSWITANALYLDEMFDGCSSLTSLNISEWQVNKVHDIKEMFYGCSSLTNLDIGNWQTTSLLRMNNLFNGCSQLTNLEISNWDTDGVTEMISVFQNCTSLTSLGIDNWYTGNVRDMNSLFKGCSSLTSLGIDNWDTGDVRYMTSLFEGCSSLTSLGIDNWNTDHLYDMNSLFKGCSSLTSLGIDNWNTGYVEDMNSLFKGCSSLTSLGIDNWDTGDVRDMTSLFEGCSSLTSLGIENLNTNDVYEYFMQYMFRGCSSLTTLFLGENFDKFVFDMFDGCSKLEIIITSREEPIALSYSSGIRDNYSNSEGIGTILCVPNKKAEKAYEASTDYDSEFYSKLDEDGDLYRVKPIIELNGDSRIVTPINSDYMEEGAVVFGTEVNIGNSGEKFYNYTLNVNSNINTDKYGIYETKYSLVDEIGIEKIVEIRKIYVMNKIIAEPKDQTVLEGKNVEFYADFDFGNVEKTYEWHMITASGIDINLTLEGELQGANTAKLIIPTVTKTGFNNTRFYCLINEVKTEEANLTVISPEDIVLMERENSAYVIGTEREGIEINSDVIKTITLLDSNIVPAEAEKHWDVSYNENGSIIAWIIKNKDDESKYDLYIGGIGGIIAPEISQYLFAGYEKCIEINNIQLLDISKVELMHYMFQDCSALSELEIGHWDTTNVTNMWYMFSGCSSLTTLDIENWNTSNVEDMPNMFADCTSLKSLEIGNWDTSKVDYMSNMFENCISLEKLEIGNWNTSNVSRMRNMFDGCTSLKSLNLNNWDTSNVTYMYYMFRDCSALENLEIGNWDISKVKYMREMFKGCTSLKILDLSNWDTSVVLTSSSGIYYMFQDSGIETLILGENFTRLNGQNMFAGCTNLKSIITQVGSPEIAENKVLTLGTNTGLETEALQNAKLYVHNEDIEKAYEDKAEFQTVFGTKDENGDIARIQPILEVAGENPTKVFVESIYDEKVDEGATVAGLDISNSGDRFYGYSVVTSGLPVDTKTEGTSGEVMYTLMYNKSSGEHMEVMTATREVIVIGAPVLMEREEPLAIEGIEVHYAIGAIRENKLDYVASKIKTITLLNSNEVPAECLDTSWDVSYTRGEQSVMAWVKPNEEDPSMYDLYIGGDGTIIAPENSEKLFYMYTNCTKIEGLDILDTSRAKLMNLMFYKTATVKDLKLSSWNVSNVTTMQSMFDECTNLATLDVTGWNTANVETMKYMFYKCEALNNLNIKHFNTGKVTDMYCMFVNCGTLESLDLSGWDVSKVTTMYSMFEDCINLTTLTLTGWNTESVETMRYMFFQCNKLQQLDISDFNTTNVKTMYSMFEGCNDLERLNVSSFNTAGVENMNYMFYGCKKLKSLNLKNFNTNAVTEMKGMFGQCSGLEVILLGENFKKLISEEMFKQCTALKAIIAQSSTPIEINQSVGLTTLTDAKLYVTDENIEEDYEDANNYEAVFGTKDDTGDIARVEPMLAMVGEAKVEPGFGQEYVDEGYKVAGFERIDSTKYTQFGYTVDTTRGEAKDEFGSYDLIYTLYLTEGESKAQLDSLTRKVIYDQLMPAPIITAKVGNYKGEAYNGMLTNQNIAIELTSEFPKFVQKYEWSLSPNEGFSSVNLMTVSEGFGRIILSDEIIGTIYFRIKNTSGAYSEVAEFDVKMDKTAPKGSIYIKPVYEDEISNNKYTNTNNVIIDVEASDNYSEASGIQISLVNEVDYKNMKSNDDFEWISYDIQKSWELTSGAGWRKVYVTIKDEAGNQSVYIAEQ